MSKKNSESQLEVLKKEREHTLSELERLRAELRAELEHEDIDDVASELVERDKTQALIVSLENKLENINHAIKQAEAGSYGICERCGNPIEPERLEIFPETTLCISCKRATERQSRSQRP
jgi:RNA polymerase-binding transcription factor DksA